MSIIDAIDRAIAIEHSARKFYTKAAAAASSKEARELFDWLAAREQSTGSELRNQRRKIVDQPGVADTIRPFRIRHMLRANQVWSDGIPRGASDRELFKAAIENERGAYTEYQRRLTEASDELTRAFYIRMVLKQEEHIRILTDRMWHLEVSRAWQSMHSAKLAPQN